MKILKRTITKIIETVETLWLKIYDFSDLKSGEFISYSNQDYRISIMSSIQQYLRSQNIQICNVTIEGEPKNSENSLVFYVETEIKITKDVKTAMSQLAIQSSNGNEDTIEGFEVYDVVLSGKPSGYLVHLTFK